jgi:hypothetical protein
MAAVLEKEPLSPGIRSSTLAVNVIQLRRSGRRPVAVKLIDGGLSRSQSRDGTADSIPQKTG